MMKWMKLLLPLLLLTLLLASCGGSSTSQEAPPMEDPEDSAPAESQPEPEPDPLRLALDRYREIIAQADTYEYDPDGPDPAGDYRYIETMDKADWIAFCEAKRVCRLLGVII